MSVWMNITGRLICLLFLVRVERRERHDGAAQPIGTTCGWGNVHPTRRALFNFTKLCSRNKLFTMEHWNRSLYSTDVGTNPERCAGRFRLEKRLREHCRGVDGKHWVEHFGHVTSSGGTREMSRGAGRRRRERGRTGADGRGRRATSDGAAGSVAGGARPCRGQVRARVARPAPAPRIDRPPPPPPTSPDARPTVFLSDRGTHLIFSVIFFPPFSLRDAIRSLSLRFRVWFITAAALKYSYGTWCRTLTY